LGQELCFQILSLLLIFQVWDFSKFSIWLGFQTKEGVIILTLIPFQSRTIACQISLRTKLDGVRKCDARVPRYSENASIFPLFSLTYFYITVAGNHLTLNFKLSKTNSVKIKPKKPNTALVADFKLRFSEQASQRYQFC